MKSPTSRSELRENLYRFVLSLLLAAAVLVATLVRLHNIRHKWLSSKTAVRRPENPPREPSAEEQRIMEDISRLIVEHKEYLHPELTLGSLSVRTGINTTYLSRAVNRTTGLGFSRWVNELRISEAVSRLSDPERTCNFSQIAYEVGFNDRTTFWRAFKQITGSSPREFCKKKCCDS